MPNIKIYNMQGAVAGEMNLSDAVFGQEVNVPLIHQVVVAQLANKRQGTKSALTRTEVRGGGKKPWRQKHTGKARQGSTRAPQWIKGGVVFAPKPRDFSKKINKRAKRAALVSALSGKVADGELLVLDQLTLTAPKTKEVAAVLKALNIEKSVLLVLDNACDNATILRAAANIPALTTIAADLINVYDLAANATVVATKAAIEHIEEAYKA